MKAQHITVQNMKEAWNQADKFMTTDYEYDAVSSSRAGYPIYRSNINYYEYICDLNDRLEVNMLNGSTVNIWVRPQLEDTLTSQGFRRNILGVWVQA